MIYSMQSVCLLDGAFFVILIGFIVFLGKIVEHLFSLCIADCVGEPILVRHRFFDKF